jgi:hypothetical protein
MADLRSAIRTALVALFTADAAMKAFFPGGIVRLSYRPTRKPLVLPVITMFDFGDRADEVVPLWDRNIQLDVWSDDLDLAEAIGQRALELLDHEGLVLSGKVEATAELDTHKTSPVQTGHVTVSYRALDGQDSEANSYTMKVVLGPYPYESSVVFYAGEITATVPSGSNAQQFKDLVESQPYGVVGLPNAQLTVTFSTSQAAYKMVDGSEDTFEGGANDAAVGLTARIHVVSDLDATQEDADLARKTIRIRILCYDYNKVYSNN